MQGSRHTEGGSGTGELAFFAINLDRSPERWAEIERLFGDMPWPLHRVRAVDAREPEAVLAVRGQRMVSPPNGIGPNLLRYRTFTRSRRHALRAISSR